MTVVITMQAYTVLGNTLLVPIHFDPSKINRKIDKQVIMIRTTLGNLYIRLTK